MIRAWLGIDQYVKNDNSPRAGYARKGAALGQHGAGAARCG